MHFYKYHGLGNDFVLVDTRRQELPVAGEDLSALGRLVCDRHFGIGADGLVLLRPVDGADIQMQIINSDGSEPEMCGNGIRCAAKYLYEHGGLRQDEMRIATLAGIMRPRLIRQNGRVQAVRVDMGEPRLERTDIPMTGPPGRVVDEPLALNGGSFRVTAVSMGNPHCLIFTAHVDRVPLTELGPKLENHPAFPRKTNVEFIEVLNRGEVRMRVWERGAGPTLACGTGACAAAVGGALNGLTERTVKVHLPGGTLDIQWAEDNHVYMTGPAAEVFAGEYTGRPV
ncbi:diaminopimelate epimerase [Desulfotomaculum copahuensis]|uniref:Diaminopimelate epimerase n=1 Tax=Desulfotomaculum copahuensis TaxID=1838280 RepID=A0A1B7LED0_9FIRM|nr:diaminopimelate epimerase [Desulfotomaculum copahuensis]OAT81462.1 diaminopimelate epimerase [Desulfotomaculum copahuensis]